MTPKQAEEKLAARRRRLGVKRGPQPLGFTITEREAVRVLASHAHSQATIAARAGLSSPMFRKALDADSKLGDAYDAGIAEERHKIDTALLKTATDPKNPRQVQAAMSLLKSRHGLTEGGGSTVSVNVNNVLALPAPLDPRKHVAMMKRLAKNSPTLIEHEAPNREHTRAPVDPIAAVKAKQGERDA